MSKMQPAHLELAQKIADAFASLPQVEAIAVAGSRGGGPGTADSASDIDMYVYTHGEIPREARQVIAQASGGTSRENFDLNYWGPSDSWINAPSGIELDIMYFDTGWMENQITQVVEKHQPSLGYTTCFWYTVWQSISFFDRGNWFAALQHRCAIPYPETLRQNIIDYNHPVLRNVLSSYESQLEKAVKRHDLVSINHRTAVLFASYFDILLAFNRQLHPGEKRLMEFVRNKCATLPNNMQADVESILLLSAADIPQLPARITGLLDHLDQMLRK